ncbi:MAG: hypothetical protein N2423_07760 [Novosphingobium sp.]|nr:hypothetical protein [Novosphingobium sp.]
MALMVIGYLLISGPSLSKEGQRRLQALRYRHSENTKDKVESQLKKAIAARRPKNFSRAGANSRIEALALRLDRTGMNWTIMQYFYASLGLALVTAVLMMLQTGYLLLSLVRGVLVGGAVPYMVVG